MQNAGESGRVITTIVRQHSSKDSVSDRRWLFARFGVVADVHTLDEEDHVFSNVRGVVGNALEVARDKNEINALPYHGGVLLHVSDQRAVNAVSQFVHGIVRR